MHIENLILGAGPAGMTAALMATRHGTQVTLLDTNATVGRKLLVTGSGRANLTNRDLDLERYVCDDPAWLASVFGKFGHSELIDFLKSIGVLTFAMSDGWTYPISESAQTVVDAFAAALHLAGVRLLLGKHVSAMRKQPGGFELKLENDDPLTCDRLVIATGGKAYPTLGSRGELFDYLRILGHTLHPLVPALAPVTAEMVLYQKLQGVRLDASVTLLLNSEPLQTTTGNLIFTQFGLNGPAVMDLSHLIAKHPGGKRELRLNLIFSSENELREVIQSHRRESLPLRVVLGAVLPPKVPPVILKLCSLMQEVTLDTLADNEIERVFTLLKALPFQVTGVRGFEFCQVTAGGVAVSQVDPLTMRSRIVPDLWLAGETLDVTGPCGGYNLQFAFSTGAVAGMSLAN